MNALLPVLLLFIAASAAVTIAAEYSQPRRARLFYVFKPLTTLLILALAASGTLLNAAYTRLILVGLLFSLMGDIWLMLPKDRFVAGLASFLAAQVCYAVAFSSGAAARGFAWIVLVLTVVGSVVLRYLWKGLPGGMRLPVIVYVAAILGMAALGVGRAAGQPSAGRTAAAAGALLFVVSDATLAIDRFRRPFRLSRAAVLGTYFAAQALIAASTFEA